MNRRPDWFRIAVILAAGAGLVYVLLIIGDSPVAWLIP